MITATLGAQTTVMSTDERLATQTIQTTLTIPKSPNTPKVQAMELSDYAEYPHSPSPPEYLKDYIEADVLDGFGDAPFNAPCKNVKISERRKGRRLVLQ
jgi:hypothetical protein